jgi:hypothetical protein
VHSTGVIMDDVKESVEVQCIDGEWSSAKLLCFKKCPNFEYDHSMYVVEDPTNGHPKKNYHGRKRIIECNGANRYAPIGNDGLDETEIRCVDGEWTALSLGCASKSMRMHAW